MTKVLKTVEIGSPPNEPQLSSEWFGGWTAFLLSTIVHTALLLTLALLVIPPGEKHAFDLVLASSASADGVQEEAFSLANAAQKYAEPDALPSSDQAVSLAKLESPEVSVSMAGDDPSAAEDAKFSRDYDRWLMLSNNQAEFRDPSARGNRTASRSAESHAEGGSASNAAANGANGAGGNTNDDPSKPRPRLVKSANYYGIEAPGTRFVFVVDASTSMRGIRWQSAVRELMKCVSELSPESEYYLIFFSDRTSFLFNQSPGFNEFQVPDEETLKKTQHWILSQELGRSTRPQAALYTAVKMEPDAIFLLSDGEFRDNSLLWVRQLVLNASKTDKKIPPIHAIGLFSDMGLSTLMEVSQLTQGQFRQIRSPFGF